MSRFALRNPWRPDRFTFLDGQARRLSELLETPSGVEVGQRLLTPGIDGAGQEVQLGDVGVDAVGQPPVQSLGSSDAACGGVAEPDVLGGDPGRPRRVT